MANIGTLEMFISSRIIDFTEYENPESVVSYYSVVYGLGEDFLRTAECESNFNKNIAGDHNTSFGLWQIHLPSHPEITKEQAIDPVWSTEWAAQKFAEGKQHLWTCWRKLKIK